MNGKEGTQAIMSDREVFNSDLRLMELAARNPSLGGRELLQEIIERGSAPEETERLQARDSYAAPAARELDHPDYRTPVEQANWLNEHSQTMRDLYEHGAGIKGDVLIIPAEEYELSDEREKPFITTLFYALQKIDDIERAREFHELALAISGETADARTQIAVFKTYYDRIRRGEREGRYETDKAEALTKALEEMRMIAAEMARLETRESADAIQAAEDREDEVLDGRLNMAARRINLREESLRLPAGLRYEQKERLVSLTIPEIDRRLERGVSREAIFKAIDRTMFRPDPAEYLRKLAELADKPADEAPERPISREEYLESQLTLLQLCEQERLHLRELKAVHIGDELEPHEDARLSQVENLARRLRQGLGRNVPDNQTGRNAHSRLFISLPERGVGENAFRLPVSSVKVYETMAKIAASEKLPLQTWAGKEGPEVRLALTKREADERSRIGAFLKNYVDERLRDPETRALNRSSAFRDARTAIFNTTTPEALGHIAADLLRVNDRRSEELRRHRAAPEKSPLPSVMPLNAWERNLLFNGRAPDHHTAEMRELRLNYGLSRRDRSARIADLRDGMIEPSPSLKAILRELETRKTARAIAHFQASVINEKMNSTGNVNLYLLSQRIAPHERTYLYEFSEERKKDLLRLPSAGRSEAVKDSNPAKLPVTRAFGAIPKENATFREYMAKMGSIERQLLNEALIERGIEFEKTASGQTGDRLTITEARALLPESQQREIRFRARNLAWQSLVPEETFDRNPLPEAVRISDTVAHIQEHLQERASIAQAVRNGFVAERIRSSEMASGESKIGKASFQVIQKGREQFVQSAIDSLNSADARRLAELDRYAAQTREDVYRAFELLDVHRRDLDLVRAHNGERVQKEDILDRVNQFRPEMVKATEAVRLSSQLHQQLSFSTAQLQAEHTAGLAKESRPVSLSLYVPSDREWHFDNLREVLNVELSRSQSGDRRPEIERSHQADDITRDH
ncbi:MAG: hypothetical protein JNJ50_10710 [Acidobacteria bacterium]|nr:hypothetical protein [Acidobacteriota bacterium]